MRDRIQRRFMEFHRKYPIVYDELIRLARFYRQADIKVGIGHLWEVCRYQLLLRKEGRFKLNNNFRSRYARLIMETEQDLKGYFETRPLRTAHDQVDEDIRINLGSVHLTEGR